MLCVLKNLILINVITKKSIIAFRLKTFFSAAVERTFRSTNPWSGNHRTGRSHQKTIDPFLTRKALLAAHEQSLGEGPTIARQGKLIELVRYFDLLRLKFVGLKIRLF